MKLFNFVQRVLIFLLYFWEDNMVLLLILLFSVVTLRAISIT